MESTQAALKALQAFPVGNDTALGDGLNSTGYLFNAPVASDQNTYIAKLDYKIDSAGKHSIFWRGNLQNDSANRHSAVPGAAAEFGDPQQQQGLRRGLDGRAEPQPGE